MDITLLMPILVFGGILLLFFGIFFYVRHRAEHRKLVKKIEHEGRLVPGETTGKVHVKERLAKIAGAFGEMVKPKDEEDLSKMQRALFNVGFRGASAVIVFFGVKVFFAIILPLIFVTFKFIFVDKPLTPAYYLCVCVLLAAVGFYLPSIWLRIKTSKRKEKITNGFPDMLDLLVVCVESGMGLDAALDRVGEEMKLGNRVIYDEFKLLNTQMRFGKARSDALRNLADRIGLDDVSNLVTVLIQTEKFGTSVGQALRIHSDFMRTERQQRAEEKAVKLPLKLLFPLIFCIFPSLFIVIMGPALIQFYRAITAR